MSFKLSRLIKAALTAVGFFVTPSASAQSVDTRPNIILVVLDDVGFMGLGPYGSDAETPTFDKLAASGAMFTRFYTTPLCAPSRASLLTGMDAHQVGMGTLVEAVSAEAAKTPGYSLEFKGNQTTIGSLLRDVGYQTFATGKWGIGKIGTNLPYNFGFDRSLVLDATGASNHAARPYLPGEPKAWWFEDGKETLPPEDYYSSQLFVDKMIEYVDSSDLSKPFFGYLSLQAIHIPIQVPTEYIDKYNGVFDAGWNVKRQERLEKAIELGLVPEGTQLAPSPEQHRDWSELDSDDQAYFSRIMQANAGMTENADEHIGRFLEYLDEIGELDNTIVAVLSDNGSEGGILGRKAGPRGKAEQLFMHIEGWNTRYDEIGGQDHMGAIGPEWAAVTSAPFKLYKVHAGDGGIRTPLIISGPGINEGEMVRGLSNIADIVPTLLDAAGTPYDPSVFFGRSQMPALSGQTDDVYGPNEGFGIETSGNAAYLRGDWKLARVAPPFGTGTWELYNMAEDPGETVDLAAENPDIFQSMLDAYTAYSTEVGVFELGPNDNAMKQLSKNALRKSLSIYWYVYLTFALLFLTLFGGILFAIKRLFFRRKLPLSS